MKNTKVLKVTLSTILLISSLYGGQKIYDTFTNEEVVITENREVIEIPKRLDLSLSTRTELHESMIEEGERLETERIAKKEAERKAREEAKHKERERLAKLEAERKAKLEAERKARQEQRAKEQVVVSRGGGYQSTYEATFYTAYCKGCSGITASGHNVKETIYYNGYRIVAGSPDIALYTKLKITLEDGSVLNAIVLDRGGDIVGKRLDILVSSKEEAYRLGRQQVKVEMIK